jgi:hypothetical protein
MPTDRPTYAKLKWNSNAERDKAYTKMLRHYPNNPKGFQGFTYKKVGADEIDMNITTMITNPVNRLKDYKLGDYKVVTMREDAPVNATGTNVAGTGDDSSTVVVKKKKKLQDKLMKRFKIKETLDRLVPDLEYTLDEMTKRKNQLKAMAVASINPNDKSDIQAAKKLAYDKKTDQPKKYVAGLSDKEKKSHDRHLEKGSKKADDDKSAYKQSPADKVAKTKLSKYTKKFRQMYGEDMSIEEAIKGLENKSKKSGMAYSILKKVYDRGMAAWKGGHRPGTTPQQWAFARVNSFITKSPGTWGKADSDLAKQVRGQ